MKPALFALYFVFCVVLLMVTFRIDERVRNFNFRLASTVISYLILALLLTTIAAYLAPRITHALFPKLSGWSEAIAIGGIVFFSFCLVSAIFGPLGFDLPGTMIRGIFFAEWKFAIFIIYDAVLLAVVGGVLRRFARS